MICCSPSASLSSPRQPRQVRPSPSSQSIYVGQTAPSLMLERGDIVLSDPSCSFPLAVHWYYPLLFSPGVILLLHSKNPSSVSRLPSSLKPQPLRFLSLVKVLLRGSRSKPRSLYVTSAHATEIPPSRIRDKRQLPTMFKKLSSPFKKENSDGESQSGANGVNGGDAKTPSRTPLSSRRQSTLGFPKKSSATATVATETVEPDHSVSKVGIGATLQKFGAVLHAAQRPLSTATGDGSYIEPPKTSGLWDDLKALK